MGISIAGVRDSRWIFLFFNLYIRTNVVRITTMYTSFMSLLSLERVCAHMFRQLAGFSWKINIQSRPKRFCYFYHLRWCCCALLRLNTRCVCMWSARWDRILCLGPSLKGIAFSIASAAASTIVKQDVCPKFSRLPAWWMHWFLPNTNETKWLYTSTHRGRWRRGCSILFSSRHKPRLCIRASTRS